MVVGSNGLEDGVLKISPDCEITGIVEVDPQIEGFKTETVFTLDREERIAGRTVVYSGGYKGFPDELKVKLDRDDAGNALREGNELRKELKLMVSVYDYGYIYNGKDHLVTRTFVIDQNTRFEDAVRDSGEYMGGRHPLSCRYIGHRKCLDIQR